MEWPREGDAHAAKNDWCKTMRNKDDILKEKAKLADDALRLAKITLGDLEACVGEASVRDLLQIFNSAVKAHRDLTSDIITIEKEDAEMAEKMKESKEEKDLSKQYNSKVDELLKSLKSKPTE
jgi:hypothetical protein